ncbi:SEC-C metal-binding domain-containing protein [Cupriavidus sp. IK-TO18]|uniref:SEC-C metal-binding domain-containing protein n=1 Tax=Cupriavidus sp. IK-TO18 TaxID=2782182 RepID=UPI0018973AEA|nr:SEC-C metal-binding domain-containing protein [Cupriavidus sp. IK-TO18]MBF6990784.1 SEC-C domain-containing protein [Cupriavidus sp. IK-TO18]
MNKSLRTEAEVFADLTALCQRPGYIYAVAHLCFRDNVIFYSGEMKADDLKTMYSPTRLIRPEINTLLGLMIKAEITWTLPKPATLQSYVEESERLLSELHDCLTREFFSGITPETLQSGSFDPFDRGAVLREPIFYSGEAAYNFQYLDLATRKYAPDAKWLLENRGFTMEQAARISKAMEAVHADRMYAIRERLKKQRPDEWTMLPVFACTVEEVAAKTNLEFDLVERVLDAFTASPLERNPGFNELHDFNILAATPLLRMPTGEYLSLQAYTLAEAIYDAPFYWMAQDKAYLPTLTKNRGDFTENFVAERLGLVFGPEHVYSNVDIFAKKSTRVSDVDVLVVWGDRAIIVQAKSKRLTLEARKGNDQVIRDDFKKAVQAAYEQGATCARCLFDKRYRFVMADGRDVELPRDIKEVYLLCVVSDHYQALSFQARQFLKTEVIDRVQAPLVLDVFALDAMTEMLQSPLQFLSYINRRANYAEQVMASQELTILSYHLTKNLWVDADVGLMHLGDDFSAGLDVAMAVRRAGVTGAATPDGVLTRFQKTIFGKIVREIEARPEAATIDLGFFLLAMSEKAVTQMSRVVDRLAARTRADGKTHDVTFAYTDGAGITFHCTDEPAHIAGPRLDFYCRRRKFKQHAERWFGLCMASNGPDVRFGVSLTYPWADDPDMAEDTKDMLAPLPIDQAISAVMSGRKRVAKVGRNDPCPCGSGEKYKKCCID